MVGVGIVDGDNVGVVGLWGGWIWFWVGYSRSVCGYWEGVGL